MSDIDEKKGYISEYEWDKINETFDEMLSENNHKKKRKKESDYNPYASNGDLIAPFENKSKLIAGLLGIFLGFFGAGRFYLGYSKIGMYQFLVSLFTFGLGSAWGLVDGIMILAGCVKTDARGVTLN